MALVNGHDPLVDQRSRLGILTRLRPCAEGADPDRPHRELRRASGLSDSNFHNHLKKLRNAGYVEVVGRFVDTGRRKLSPRRFVRLTAVKKARYNSSLTVTEPVLEWVGPGLVPGRPVEHGRAPPARGHHR